MGGYVFFFVARMQTTLVCFCFVFLMLVGSETTMSKKTGSVAHTKKKIEKLKVANA